MCRLLGVVASEPTDFKFSLREGPRSLAALSRLHPDGWGVGVFGDEAGWSLARQPLCAADDEAFHEVVAASRGALLLAHVRKGTVGALTTANTHPFRRGRWVFAHNGTIEDLGALRRGVSAHRLAEVLGETDSELLFAQLLTRLDEAGVADRPAGEVTDAVLARLVGDLAASALGAVSFLLADGATLYAHRRGRTLHTLDRVPGDAVQVRRESPQTGAVIETSWSPRRRAILVASEQLSDEPWQEVEEGALLRIDRRPRPSLRRVV